MRNIEIYLEKFRSFGLNDRRVRDAALATLNSFGIHLDLKSIALKDGKLVLTASPAKQSEIYIHKREILAKIRAELLPVGAIETR